MAEHNRNQHNPARRNKFSDIPGVVTHIYPEEDSALRNAIRAEVEAYLKERESEDKPLDFSSIPGHIQHTKGKRQ